MGEAYSGLHELCHWGRWQSDHHLPWGDDVASVAPLEMVQEAIGRNVFPVPQQEEAMLKGFLLWEQGVVGHWQASPVEEERKVTQGLLEMQGMEKW